MKRVHVRNVRESVEGEYIGRAGRARAGSPLGNPFVIGRDGDRAAVIAKYRTHFAAQLGRRDGVVMKDLERLVSILRHEGMLTLLCWCAPEACHGDVVAQWIESQVERWREPEG